MSSIPKSNNTKIQFALNESNSMCRYKQIPLLFDDSTSLKHDIACLNLSHNKPINLKEWAVDLFKHNAVGSLVQIPKHLLSHIASNDI